MSSLGILVSYADVLSARADNVRAAAAEEVANQGAPLVWDSGAFSVFTGKADITVEQHTAWVLQRQHTPNRRYIGLDVLGKPAATLRNYQDQRAAGARVEPTATYGASAADLDALLAVGDTQWLNCGGMVGRGPSEIASFLAFVRRHTPPELKIHALGCTTPAVLRAVPVDAVDSSSWLSCLRYRTVSLFNRRSGRWHAFPLWTDTKQRRATSWRTAHRHAALLRGEYGVSPTEPLDRAQDRYFILRTAIAGVEQLARWVEDVHNRPVTMYLAGSDPSGTARTDAVLDNQQQQVPA